MTDKETPQQLVNRLKGFTPGPWEASDRGDYSDFDGNSNVVIGDDMRVAVVQNSGDYWAYANAALIAAAPDLHRICGEQLARIAELTIALVEQNDLLRSAKQIATREGVEGRIASTNWDAYYNRVSVSLKKHHALVNSAIDALHTPESRAAAAGDVE